MSSKPPITLTPSQYRVITDMRKGASLVEFTAYQGSSATYRLEIPRSTRAKILPSTARALAKTGLVAPPEHPGKTSRHEWKLTDDGVSREIVLKDPPAPADADKPRRAGRVKVYDMGNHGFVTSDVVELLGAPEHHRQQRVMVAARSRQEAVRLLLLVGGFYTPASDKELHEAMGGDVDALSGAGVFDQYRVLVTNRSWGHRETAVVSYRPDRSAYVVGSLVRHPDVPGSPMEYTPVP